ncbi:MAG: OB-fold domain-containing protein [Betaproteobacteria bacterium]
MHTDELLPVAAGLFEGTGSAARLIGTRCTSCGSHYFPKSLSCRNPQCLEKAIQDVRLSREGTLYSYTVQHYQPPALFRMADWAPYAIGSVELPEGLRVMGMLTGCDPTSLQIGMALELTVETLYRDAQGREVQTYKFQPRAAQEQEQTA